MSRGLVTTVRGRKHERRPPDTMPDELRIDQSISPKSVDVTPHRLMGKTQRFGYLAYGGLFMATDDAEHLVARCFHVCRVPLEA